VVMAPWVALVHLKQLRIGLLRVCPRHGELRGPARVALDFMENLSLARFHECMNRWPWQGRPSLAPASYNLHRRPKQTV
jgi:hypothetical protein